MQCHFQKIISNNLPNNDILSNPLKKNIIEVQKSVENIPKNPNNLFDTNDLSL